MNRKLQAGMLTATGALSLFQLTSALAQESSPATSARGARVEEIVVTAQRRSQSMQEVPVSVTALTGDALAKANLTSSFDLDMMTPGLVTTSAVGGTQTYIRGVGSQANMAAGTEGTVAYYVDGVYFPSSYGSVFNLANLAHIEVLRGPQGTLFGRNTTGGVVQVVTKEPSFTPLMNVGVSYGNYDTLIGSFNGSTGLTDSIAASLTLYSRDQGQGYGRNTLLDQDVMLDDEHAVRGDVLFRKDENFSIRWTADYNNKKSDLGATRLLVHGRSVLGAEPLADPYDFVNDAATTAKVEQWGVNQTIKADLGFGDFQSITAFRNEKTLRGYDADYTPTLLFVADINENFRTFQQEFLLTGDIGALGWTTGLFYFDMSQSRVPIGTIATEPFFNRENWVESHVESYAAYAQGTYAIADAFNLTAGVRYTRDEQTMSATTVAGPWHPLAGAVLGSVNAAELANDEVTWRVGADYHFSSGAMAYVSVSKGYKSGQFNLSSPAQQPTFPETLMAYEVGIKADFLDQRLRFNASAFHYDSEDIQLSAATPPPTAFLTLNAAKGKVDGAEFEITVVPSLPIGDLQIGAYLTLLDARYDRFPRSPYFVPNPYTAAPAGVTCPTPTSGAPGGGSACTFDATGQTMIRSPKWTAALNLNYGVDVAGGLLEFSTNYYHSDGFFWEASNRTKQAPYDVLNAEVSFAPGEGRWRYRIFGRNLTDDLYYLQVFEQSFGDIGAPQVPRTYGAGVDYRFR